MHCVTSKCECVDELGKHSHCLCIATSPLQRPGNVDCAFFVQLVWMRQRCLGGTEVDAFLAGVRPLLCSASVFVTLPCAVTRGQGMKGPVGPATSDYASQEKCANRTREAASPQTSLFVHIMPSLMLWLQSCTSNFKISISSWTEGKPKAQTLCTSWSFDSRNLCPTAWSTGPSGKGGWAVVLALATSTS